MEFFSDYEAEDRALVSGEVVPSTWLNFPGFLFVEFLEVVGCEDFFDGFVGVEG